MNTLRRRRHLLQAGLACALPLPAFHAGACEFFASTLRVTHPWTRATVDDASAAVVCMKFDEVTQDDRLVGIETAVAAGAEMAGPDAPGRDIDFAIPKGRESHLSETGTFIRLTGLTQALEIGRTYPIRLLFEVAGPLRADLSVDYMRFR